MPDGLEARIAAAQEDGLAARVAAAQEPVAKGCTVSDAAHTVFPALAFAALLVILFL